jgi:hypothetical protein
MLSTLIKPSHTSLFSHIRMPKINLRNSQSCVFCLMRVRHYSWWWARNNGQWHISFNFSSTFLSYTPVQSSLGCNKKERKNFMNRKSIRETVMLYVIVVWYAFSWAICTHYMYTVQVFIAIELYSFCCIFISSETIVFIIWICSLLLLCYDDWLLLLLLLLAQAYYSCFMSLSTIIMASFDCFCFFCLDYSLCMSFFSTVVLSVPFFPLFFILYISFLLRFLFMSHLMTMLKANHIE